ncbi:ATP-binding cassette domain-containing protein [Candidatus Enterococcus ikei]|uniref:ATP-binding cassette domain-containing protein n=1 Tax=Candidatus Enterococcus ikei TaxID=2815326 RepID=A0ABS3H1R1_9ENTE|nr:ATP-binding cassette domain-containing protein [Enterococcus sp. DIV0869a]MBO0441438.1 ATP-binding cassette domain-containing protein [Enterococcus sp. DIV0869a]
MSIRVENLSKSYKSKSVFNDISLEFESNKTYALIGASGSGKTTLLNAIARIEKPTSGKILLNGTDIFQINEQKFFKNTLGYVFQNYALIDEKSVAYNLSLINKNKEEQEKVLVAVDLDRNLLKAKIYELSGGQAQRVSLARMLLKKPSIILADEPTGALDQETGNEIISLLLNLANADTYVIIATHDPNVYNKVDEVIDLKDYSEE